MPPSEKPTRVPVRRGSYRPISITPKGYAELARIRRTKGNDMSDEPTLEDLEAAISRGPFSQRDGILAREIIALQEQVGVLVELSDEHCHRLDALEQQERPEQEDGHLAVARPASEPEIHEKCYCGHCGLDTTGTARQWMKRAGQEDGHLAVARPASEPGTENTSSTHQAEMERLGRLGIEEHDAALRILRLRDDAIEARRVWMESCHTAQAERDAARAQAERYEEALCRISSYGETSETSQYLARIARDALNLRDGTVS